jgi:hypothetical protein
LRGPADLQRLENDGCVIQRRTESFAEVVCELGILEWLAKSGYGPHRTAPVGSASAGLQSALAETVSALSASPGPDQDGDGLTDLKESWWLTDTGNPDTDGDGIPDGE